MEFKIRNIKQSKRQSPYIKNKGISNFLIVLLLILTFTIGTIFGLVNSKQFSLYLLTNGGGKIINQEEAYKYKQVDFENFFKVWNIIKEDYLYKDDITDTQLFYGALAGSVASLNDPYSIFLDPQQAKEFENELEGNFEGIGAEIGLKNDILTVISALPNTPAMKAGLMPKDQILAIDDFDTSYITLDYAISLIRGKSGTIVKLLIKRENEPELLELKIERAQIEVESVTWKILNNNIAYIELNNFNQDTSQKFKKAINNILSYNPKGVILDLRFNPGGYLQTAIDVASYWVEDGLIVKEDYGDPAKDYEYNAKGKAKLKDLQTVVLINAGSASASEIVAGALQDYHLATLVGETSFGKGTIQDLSELDDGSIIKLTVARWLTPSGRLIEDNGIDPDIEVKLTKEDYNNDQDPQLDKAIDIIDLNN
jgi:carboxyl-terminal processing protease